MRLALMLPNWVGDACMATPTLRALRFGIPELSEFCWVGRPAPLMVLEGLPWADSTLCYKPRSKQSCQPGQQGTWNRRGLVRELRRRRMDAILLMTNSLSTALIAFMAGIPRRIGYARDGRGFLLTQRVRITDGNRDARNDPCIDTYLRLAEAMGCSIPSRRTELATTGADRQLADRFWHEVGFSPERPTILLNTGAATAETKRWPIEHAVRAAGELSRQHGYQILVHCGPAEREIANRIEDQTALPGVRSMGRWSSLPLGLSKALIERSTLVISTDSGPRHIAIAMNKPVISIFGSIAPDMTRSYNEPETIVTLGLACQPCGKYECPLKHTQCMNGLDAERVVRAALLALEQQKRRAG